MKRDLMLTLVVGGCVCAAGCHGAAQDGDGNVVSSQRAHQEEISYYDNGNRKELITFYRDRTGHIVRDGTNIEWHDNGQMWLECSYTEGVKEGKLTEWYPDGTKARYGEWANGKEIGIWQAWQPTGEKEWEAMYRDGKIVGNKTFWTDEKVVRIEHYGDDGFIDKMEAWLSNGAKMCQGSYKGAKQDGTWTYWCPDGRIKAVGEWKNGKPWSGICSIPAAGDAGSWGGLGTFRLYKNGVDVGPAVLPPASSAPATTGK
jgi:antitoxin component YwqK of YwqJK toxin-antitoxin module